jgi:hypothetical protein
MDHPTEQRAPSAAASSSNGRRLRFAFGGALVLVASLLAVFLVRERNHGDWACPADRLGVSIVSSDVGGGAPTALGAVARSIPLIADDSGVPETVLRQATASFSPPTGSSATYRIVTDDGLVAQLSVTRLRDGTWGVGRVEQCFREP